MAISIPKVDKFKCLNSLLEGIAFKAIQGFTLSETMMLPSLCSKKHFGNPQKLMSAHMEGLLKVALPRTKPFRIKATKLD